MLPVVAATFFKILIVVWDCGLENPNYINFLRAFRRYFMGSRNNCNYLLTAEETEGYVQFSTKSWNMPIANRHHTLKTYCVRLQLTYFEYVLHILEKENRAVKLLIYLCLTFLGQYWFLRKQTWKSLFLLGVLVGFFLFRFTYFWTNDAKKLESRKLI